MITFESLESIVLEITSKCQASCPMCARNLFGGITNPNLIEDGWSLDDYKNIINYEVLNQIKEIIFCGNFGDCVINSNFLEMCRYTAVTNPNIKVQIHTNGSMRTKEWWKELAQALPKNHVVKFALDGLEDTHSLYRIGTNYHKILENAKSFIENKGTAEWAMIRFDHNAHQVEEARELSKKLGFTSFSLKDSNRFTNGKQKVVDKNNNLLYHLYPYKKTKVNGIDSSSVDYFLQNLNNIKIDCVAQKLKQIYIDTHGDLYPCCFTAGIPYHYMQSDDLLYEGLKRAKKEHKKIIKKFGGKDKINTKKYTVKEILSNKDWVDAWANSWNRDELIVCSKICGKLPKKIFFSPKEQHVNDDS